MGKMMSTADVAKKVGNSEPTLRAWRYQGIGPPFIKVGKLVKYDEADVDRWLAQQRTSAGLNESA